VIDNNIKSLKSILTTTISAISVIAVYFTIFASSLYSDSNLFSSSSFVIVEAKQQQQSTNLISDHKLHGYLEQMNGHLDASIINVQNNNSVLAVAHALHPIEEIVDIINNRLIQTNEILTKEFSNKLNQYVQTVKSNDLNKILKEKAELENLLNDALDQSISLEKRNNNRDYILNVTAELIIIASEEYNEAMYNGRIINLLEYQDGQQFIKRAIMLLEESQALLSSENDKKYIDKIRKIEKDMVLKRDPSDVDMNVKDMICEIKKGIYC
jgi:hypothetical protein